MSWLCHQRLALQALYTASLRLHIHEPWLGAYATCHMIQHILSSHFDCPQISTSNNQSLNGQAEQVHLLTLLLCVPNSPLCHLCLHFTFQSSATFFPCPVMSRVSLAYTQPCKLCSFERYSAGPALKLKHDGHKTRGFPSLMSGHVVIYPGNSCTVRCRLFYCHCAPSKGNFVCDV